MTFQTFLEKYNGRLVDFDGWYGAQCMDLMHQYIYECLGLTDKTILAAPDAKSVYVNYPNVSGSQYFDRIANTPTGVPKEGDIIFWSYAPYGHVAIFIEGDSNKFRSFDQNYPTGSLPHVQEHTYGYCLGWLRFKQLPDSDLIKQRADAFVAVASELGKPVDKDIILADIRHFKELEDKLRQSNQALDDANVKLTAIQTEANNSKKKVDELTANNMSLQEALQRLTEESKQQGEALLKLELKVKELQEVQPINKVSFSDLLKELFSRFRR